MSKYKIQSMKALIEEMKAVGRGKKPAPVDAARPSFNSVQAVVRLLTPENRRLCAEGQAASTRASVRLRPGS
jgi:predicted transcriptional regulator